MKETSLSQAWTVLKVTQWLLSHQRRTPMYDVEIEHLQRIEKEETERYNQLSNLIQAIKDNPELKTKLKETLK